MNRTSKRLARGSAVVLVTLLLAPAAASATPTSPDDLPEPRQQQLADSVHVWDLTGSVHVWDLTDSVSAVEQVQTKGKETTITLSTDILFTPDSSKLPTSASTRIATIVKDVPQGAKIMVDGHTDSVKGKVDNQKLSTDRAKAVAAAVARKRPDLVAKVAGHADSDPVQTEDPKDPSTRAANRRVEITYRG